MVVVMVAVMVVMVCGDGGTVGVVVLVAVMVAVAMASGSTGRCHSDRGYASWDQLMATDSKDYDDGTWEDYDGAKRRAARTKAPMRTTGGRSSMFTSSVSYHASR